MAKYQLLFALSSLCLVSVLVGTATAASFRIEGKVYCDTCRAGFETELTTYIEGAKVKMECRHFETGEIHHTDEAVTDNTGSYMVEAVDDHQEEICEVILVSSPVADCNEVIPSRDRARISLTRNNGMATGNRFASPLGFLKEVPLPNCGVLLQQYRLGLEGGGY